MSKSLDLYLSYSDIIDALIETTNMLCAQGIEVQSQPNGFMRLALEGQKNAEEGLFLHIWLNELPCQKYLHTHVFHLTSRVIKGKIKDMQYSPEFNSDGKYQLVTSQCTEDSCLIQDRISKVNMKLIRTLYASTNDIYEMSKKSFHISYLCDSTPSAITLMKKSDIENESPILAIPIGTHIPTKAFNRKQINQDFAWKTIKKLLLECRKK